MPCSECPALAYECPVLIDQESRQAAGRCELQAAELCSGSLPGVVHSPASPLCCSPHPQVPDQGLTHRCVLGLPEDVHMLPHMLPLTQAVCPSCLWSAALSSLQVSICMLPELEPAPLVRLSLTSREGPQLEMIVRCACAPVESGAGVTDTQAYIVRCLMHSQAA